MRSRYYVALLLVFLAGACGDDSNGGPVEPPPPPPVDEGAAPVAGCTDGSLPSGSLYRFCFPETWNGELVVYAHGYVQFPLPLAIQDNVIGGVRVSTLVTSLGYAFATTSYRANGLVADVAVDDLAELDDQFRRSYRPDPSATYLVGLSEGGLVAALAAERDPERYSGVLAACGPIGDFATQIDYYGDFRVVFDYFFPDLIPGSVVDVPAFIRGIAWDQIYVPLILQALAENPEKTAQLLLVTDAPVGDGITTVGETVTGILWYSVFATEDAQERLGGQPYDNTTRVYQGSLDDAALNAGVERFAADPGARAAIGRFDTSGDLTIPMVTLHTTGDPIVPFVHESLYGAKVSAAGAASMLAPQTVTRYGHCSFQLSELQSAFGLLVQWAGGDAAVAARP